MEKLSNTFKMTKLENYENVNNTRQPPVSTDDFGWGTWVAYLIIALFLCRNNKVQRSMIPISTI